MKDRLTKCLAILKWAGKVIDTHKMLLIFKSVILPRANCAPFVDQCHNAKSSYDEIDKMLANYLKDLLNLDVSTEKVI